MRTVSLNRSECFVSTFVNNRCLMDKSFCFIDYLLTTKKIVLTLKNLNYKNKW